MLLETLTRMCQAIDILRPEWGVPRVDGALAVLVPQAEKVTNTLERIQELASFEAAEIHAWIRGEVARPHWLMG